MTVRVNWLLMLIYFTPTWSLLFFIPDAYQRFVNPHIYDSTCTKIVCDYKNCQVIDKHLKYLCDYKDDQKFGVPSQMQSETNAFLFGLFMRSERWEFFWFVFLTMGMSVFTVLVTRFYFVNYIRFDGDKLSGSKVEMLVNLIGKNRLFIKGFQLNVRDITKIKVITVTPYISERTSTNQINWRDNVEITFLEDNVQKIEIVSLFVYPGFKKVLQEIVSRYPEIKIEYYKKTLMEKLREYS